MPPKVYSVPIGGPAAAGLKLNKALVLGGSVEGGLISPDSRRVVYRADQETDGIFELYSVPIRGPAADGIKLNKALVPGGDVVNLSADQSGQQPGTLCGRPGDG